MPLLTNQPHVLAKNVTGINPSQVVIVDSSSVVTGLPNGTTGQVLTSQGTGSNPTWAAAPSTGTVMIGATSMLDGVSGSVPKPLAGQQTYFLRGDGTWDSVGGASTMTGATSMADGTGGLTPQSLAGQQGLFLRGDATWAAVSASPMAGATSGSDGTGGSVPAPLTGQQNWFLRGDGTWAQGAARVALSISTGAIAVNAAASDNFYVTMNANATVSAPSNLVTGKGFVIEIIQDGTGGWTLAYNTVFKFPGGAAPILSTAAGAIDLLTCYYDGTIVLASLLKAFA